MLNFKKQLLDDIDLYCKLNSIDVDKFCNDLLEQAFVSKKYGTVPNIVKTKSVPPTEQPTDEPPTIITKKIDTDDDDYYKTL